MGTNAIRRPPGKPREWGTKAAVDPAPTEMMLGVETLPREDLRRLAEMETMEIDLLSDSDRELERRLRLRGGTAP